MKKNMGALDRAIRIIAALPLGLLISTGGISGVAALFLGAVAVVLFVTGVAGVCPLYSLLKLSTRRPALEK